MDPLDPSEYVGPPDPMWIEWIHLSMWKGVATMARFHWPDQCQHQRQKLPDSCFSYYSFHVMGSIVYLISASIGGCSGWKSPDLCFSY